MSSDGVKLGCGAGLVWVGEEDEDERYRVEGLPLCCPVVARWDMIVWTKLMEETKNRRS